MLVYCAMTNIRRLKLLGHKQKLPHPMFTHAADKSNMQKVYSLGNCTKQTFNTTPRLWAVFLLCAVPTGCVTVSHCSNWTHIYKFGNCTKQTYNHEADLYLCCVLFPQLF